MAGVASHNGLVGEDLRPGSRTPTRGGEGSPGTSRGGLEPPRKATPARRLLNPHTRGGAARRGPPTRGWNHRGKRLLQVCRALLHLQSCTDGGDRNPHSEVMGFLRFPAAPSLLSSCGSIHRTYLCQRDSTPGQSRPPGTLGGNSQGNVATWVAGVMSKAKDGTWPRGQVWWVRGWLAKARWNMDESTVQRECP